MKNFLRFAHEIIISLEIRQSQFGSMGTFIWVFIAWVSLRLPPCLSTPQSVFINSPSAAMSYLEKTKLSKDNSFSDWTEDQGKDLCKRMLVNTVSFSLASDPSSDIVMTDFPTFAENDVKTIFLPDLHFTFKDMEFVQDVPALICVTEETGTQWAVKTVNSTDILLLFRKSSDAEQFEISGLLESMPTFSPQADINAVENKYVAAKMMQRDNGELISGNKKDQTHFNKLDLHSKFRLCAAAHLALTKFEGKECVQKNVVHLDENIRVGKILVADYSIFADLIPCAVNEDIQNARFYITNDPSSMDSAFIVKPVPQSSGTSKSAKIVYNIALYLENITTLKTPSRQLVNSTNSTSNELLF